MYVLLVIPTANAPTINRGLHAASFAQAVGEEAPSTTEHTMPENCCCCYTSDALSLAPGCVRPHSNFHWLRGWKKGKKGGKIYWTYQDRSPETFFYSLP